MLESKEFAEILWKRVSQHLLVEDLADVRPFGFDNEGGKGCDSSKGVWQPIGINECIRFTRYHEGGHFKPHRDGGFVRNDEERSVYSSTSVCSISL